MSFPTNALPAEFQEEHGSVDLTANDQASDSDGEDEDLELGRTGQGVWLCKVSLSAHCRGINGLLRSSRAAEGDLRLVSLGWAVSVGS